MNWKYKAIVQQIISQLPNGEKINYLGQKHLTKKLPVDKNEFLLRVTIAKRHFEKYLQYRERGGSPEQAIFYEFGAGWDMIIPLSYYFLGINSQILVDIRPLIKTELINSSLERFKTYQTDLKSLAGMEIKRRVNFIPASSKNSIAQLIKEYYGILYEAPCDARNTPLKSDSVDFISSTNTLEHVPKNDILPILEECYRILKKGGAISCEIDYKDHYSYFDNNISAYNFLKYPDPAWRIFNSSILHQNRLRHKDYIDIAKNTRFNIIEETCDKPTEEDIATLKKMKIYGAFKTRYSLDELAIRRGSLILKK